MSRDHNTPFPQPDGSLPAPWPGGANKNSPTWALFAGEYREYVESISYVDPRELTGSMYLYGI